MTSVVGWEHHADLRGRNNSGNTSGASLFSTSAGVFPRGHFRLSGRRCKHWVITQNIHIVLVDDPAIEDND